MGETAPTEQLRVRHPDTAPPGGWSYHQPETGRVWSEFGSIDILVQQVRQHRALNSLPAGDPEQDVHQHTAERLIDAGMAGRVSVVSAKRRSLSQYWRGLRGFGIIHSFEHGNRPILVSQELATMRAAVCAECPRNRIVRQGALQRVTNTIMHRLVDDRTTPHDARLDTCEVCSCETATLVHLTGEVLQAAGALNNLHSYPPGCWKHTANQP